MKLPELTKLVRRYLAEAGTAVYDTAEVEEQVRRSARELAKTYRLFSRQVHLRPDATGRAVLPDDFAAMREIAKGEGALRGYRQTRLPNSSVNNNWAAEADLDRLGTVQLSGESTIHYWAYAPDPSATTEAWAGVYSEHHDVIALHAAHVLSASGGGPTAAREGIWAARLQGRLEDLKSALISERLLSKRMTFRSHTTFPTRRGR